LKIHREGYPFIAIFVAVNLLAFLLAAWLGWLLLPVTIWCVAFFRDPERKAPQLRSCDRVVKRVSPITSSMWSLKANSSPRKHR